MAMRDRVNQRATQWATRVASRLAPDDLVRLSTTMLDTIDDVSERRWEAAKERAAATAGDIRPDKIDALTRSFSRELGAAGAAAGAAAAAPGVGTMATLAATTAELGWFTGPRRRSDPDDRRDPRPTGSDRRRTPGVGARRPDLRQLGPR